MPNLVLRQCLLLALYLKLSKLIQIQQLAKRMEPDGVVSLQSDPVRDRLVLLLLNSQSALGAKWFVRWLWWNELQNKQVNIKSLINKSVRHISPSLRILFFILAIELRTNRPTIHKRFCIECIPGTAVLLFLMVVSFRDTFLQIYLC